MVIKTLKSNGIFLILPIVRDPSTFEREHVRICFVERERERERGIVCKRVTLRFKLQTHSIVVDLTMLTSFYSIDIAL